MWAPLLQVLLILGHVREALSACKSAELDFIVVEGDALLASLEDDVRSDLAKLGISVATRFLSKDDFNSNMTSGNFNLCFSETWGPPYDPHSFAAAWKSPDEAHFSALKGLQAPMTQDQLTTKVSDVLLEENLVQREQKWKEILTATHQQAIDLPFSGKRIPTVLSNRLAGYVAGQQQFDYPVHTLRTLSGSSTITVAPGAQTGLFDTVGRLDPHTYRPNEFFANNWVYEGLLTYGPGGVREPALAESWTVTDLSGGGQEYRFALKQNVKFHDGSDWNCTVAKLNFDHVLAKPLTTGDYHGWYDLPLQVSSWSCAGTYEFVLFTKDKYYPLLQELTYIRPLRMLSPAMFASGISTDPMTENSCHAGWGSITGNGETLTCAGVRGVSGTGPFKFVETLPNGDVRFDKHADYWRGEPQISQIIVKKYSGHAAVMAALLDGSLDAVMGAGVLEPADFNTIRTAHSSSFQVFLGPAIQNRVIIMNANKAPTDDLTLRKVIMHAVNKAAIIDKELFGMAEPVDALFPKNAPYCDVDLTPRWDYDFEKAQLLWCPAESAGENGDVTMTVLIVVVVVVVVAMGVVAFILFKVGKKQGARACTARIHLAAFMV
ncbi:nikA [Symbiodinium natans]|uniref:NikA protein n=1 Tax=Symbiodinium natans TaxID=878477 RepID=A0A812MFL0_9DINO|nr:nikA [Symbiodinium natans]